MTKVGPTYYEVHGEGDPLFLVLGFTGTTLSWTPILDTLKKRFQVIIFDNRGFGNSDIPPPPYSMDMFVNDLHHLQQHLGISKAYFLGHSMGGCIVQAFTLKHPESVKSLVISSSTPKTPATALYSFEEIARLIESGADRVRIIKAMLPWIFSNRSLENQEKIQTLLERASKDPTPFTLNGYLGQLAVLKEFDSRNQVSDIQKKTLILAGDQDILLPPPGSQFLKDRIPQAKIAWIPGAGHVTYMEEPDLYSQIVTDFLTH